MAKAGSKTRPCDKTTRDGRMAKAHQFLDAAKLIDVFADDDNELGDAYITLCIHAGIAAADVICCARLGAHAQGESHVDAVGLLGKVDLSASKHLSVLLGMKTRSSYSPSTSTAKDRKQAHRAATALVRSATAA